MKHLAYTPKYMSKEQPRCLDPMAEDDPRTAVLKDVDCPRCLQAVIRDMGGRIQRAKDALGYD